MERPHQVVIERHSAALADKWAIHHQPPTLIPMNRFVLVIRAGEFYTFGDVQKGDRFAVGLNDVSFVLELQSSRDYIYACDIKCINAWRSKEQPMWAFADMRASRDITTLEMYDYAITVSMTLDVFFILIPGALTTKMASYELGKLMFGSHSIRGTIFNAYYWNNHGPSREEVANREHVEGYLRLLNG